MHFAHINPLVKFNINTGLNDLIILDFCKQFRNIRVHFLHINSVNGDNNV